MRKKLFQREALIFKTRVVDPGVFVVSESGSNSDFFIIKHCGRKMRSCFKSDPDFFRWGLIGMSHFSWVSSGSFIFVESRVGSDQSEPWNPDTSKQKRFVLYYCVGAGGGETGREVGCDGCPPEA